MTEDNNKLNSIGWASSAWFLSGIASVGVAYYMANGLSKRKKEQIYIQPLPIKYIVKFWICCFILLILGQFSYVFEKIKKWRYLNKIRKNN